MRPAWLACLIGLLIFLAWGGAHILSPKKIGWLMTGLDTSSHYLAWESFRGTSWHQWPIGANPAYGSDAPGTIVLADSIPVAAILFKSFDRVLPADFQYFGIWLFSCFILQAWFAYKLMGRFSDDPWLRLLGAGFFATASIFLLRAYLHPALAGQWILLAAIYFCFDVRLRRRAWCCLLVFAVLVHAYLFAMAAALWLTDVIGRVIHRSEKAKPALQHVLIVLFAVVLVMWAAGYFIPSSMAITPFRSYTNLLTPLWSGTCRDGGGLCALQGSWSWFTPDVKLDSDVWLKSGDGFGYFGAGFLILLPAALLYLTRRWPERLSRPWTSLSVVCLALLIYAVGNLVYVGNHLLFSYRQPQVIEHLSRLFRGAARMEWPAWYLILTGTLAAIIRGSAVRSPVPAKVLLGAALILQCADLSRAAVITNQSVTKRSHFPNRMVDTAWAELALHHQHLVYLNSADLSPYMVTWIPNYVQITRFAVLHRLTINQAYLARLDEQALTNTRKARVASLLNGDSESSTFYIVDDQNLWVRILCAPDRGQWRGRIDGFRVIVPDTGSVSRLPQVESCPGATGATPQTGQDTSTSHG